MLYAVEICRTGYGVRTIEVEATHARYAAEKALDEAGVHAYSEHHSDYEVNSVVDPNTHRSLDFSEPLPGTLGDLIASMPLFCKCEWDQSTLDIECDSECGRNCSDVLTKGGEFASICADVDAQIVRAVVRQVSIMAIAVTGS